VKLSVGIDWGSKSHAVCVPERVNDFETAVERILCCVRSQQLRFAVGCELMLKVAA